MTSCSYLQRLALCALILAAPFVMHAWLIDPVGIFGTRHFPERGYDRYGRVVVKGDRVVKSIHLAQGDNDIVLFGNSRITDAHDPSDAAFDGYKVFNGAFPAGRYLEITHAMQLALVSQPRLKRMIVGVDPLSFIWVPSEADYNLSLIGGESRMTGYLWSVFSLDSINKSYQFWLNVRSQRPKPMSMDGFDRRAGKFVGSYHKHFMNLNFVDSGGTPCGDNDQLITLLRERLVAFEQTLVDIRQHGVQVDLVFTVRHALPLAFDELAGKTIVLESYKRLFVELIERVRRSQGAGQISLWDFNELYPEISFDPVPREDSDMPAKYFFEASHYNTRVGSAMNAVIMGKSTYFPNFGTQLSSANVDAQINLTRERLKSWMDAHPEEIAVVRNAAEEKRQCSLRATAQKMVRN